MILIFHPLYQNSFEFTEMPEETVGGSKMVRIHFQHVPGTRSTAALHLESRDLPLDLKGDAWILPESASIVRIAAELSAPPTEVGLRTLSADVSYAPLLFQRRGRGNRLPASAAIEVATARQHWRNLHQFEDYRCFSVSSGKRAPSR